MAFEESIELVEGVTGGYKMAVLDAFVNQGGQEKWRETDGTRCGERQTTVCTTL